MTAPIPAVMAPGAATCHACGRRLAQLTPIERSFDPAVDEWGPLWDVPAVVRLGTHVTLEPGFVPDKTRQPQAPRRYHRSPRSPSRPSPPVHPPVVIECACGADNLLPASEEGVAREARAHARREQAVALGQWARKQIEGAVERD